MSKSKRWVFLLSFDLSFSWNCFTAPIMRPPSVEVFLAWAAAWFPTLFHDLDLRRFLGFPPFFSESLIMRGPIGSYNPRRDRTCKVEDLHRHWCEREKSEKRKGKTQSRGSQMARKVKRGRKKNRGEETERGRERERERWPVFSGRYNPSIVIDTMNGRSSIPCEVWLHKRRTAITV